MALSVRAHYGVCTSLIDQGLPSEAHLPCSHDVPTLTFCFLSMTGWAEAGSSVYGPLVPPTGYAL